MPETHSAVAPSRRLLAELLGSLLLAATVVGSGIMAERLAGGNTAFALLANTGATMAVLATLIALLGPPSGVHFNPAVSLVEALRGKLSWRLYPQQMTRDRERWTMDAVIARQTERG